MADAEAVVRDLMAKVAAQRGLAGPVEIRPLSSGGGNYTSALFAASAGDLKAFAKIAIVGDTMRDIMNAEVLFTTEQIVYNELAKTYSTILAKHEASGEFRFPEVYASLPDWGRETLLMEDLTAQGYQMPSRHDSVDWLFAAAAVQKLAAFHALSFAYEKEEPEEFAKMADRLKYVHKESSNQDEATLKATWEGMMGSAVQVVNEEHRPRLVKLLSGMKDFIKFNSPISRTVLTHGDYRASNLLFKEQDGELDIVVVDYQTVHAGCPASDLLYFVFLGTDQEFRRRHYQDLLEHYHRELSVALDRLGVDVDQVYPWKVFDDEVKEMLPSALQVSAVILPMVMVAEESAPQLAGDADLSQFAIKPSTMFAKRFAGLVADCVEWGAL